ncbi:hypothetical protein CQS04_00615 [Chryseomicrobium excrementi]|uniref:Uncharacterized protein n=1 Tax=Chryseomicrobium excrementi TaxID=2041346 RepID=A0A2M9F1T2_9BACL|nr:hypothetical protein CQS04_00615 [Chryseomicrobium excrementi]
MISLLLSFLSVAEREVSLVGLVGVDWWSWRDSAQSWHNPYAMKKKRPLMHNKSPLYADETNPDAHETPPMKNKSPPMQMKPRTMQNKSPSHADEPPLTHKKRFPHHI